MRFSWLFDFLQRDERTPMLDGNFLHRAFPVRLPPLADFIFRFFLLFAHGFWDGCSSRKMTSFCRWSDSLKYASRSLVPPIQ